MTRRESVKLNRMARLWRAGWNPIRIGLICGVPKETVEYMAHRGKWNGPKHRPPPAAEIALARWAGWPDEKIARRFGVKTQAVGPIAWAWENSAARTKRAKSYARPPAEAIKKPKSEIQAVPKRCLCCGGSFSSTHAGNRVCPPCKSTKEWRAAA